MRSDAVARSQGEGIAVALKHPDRALRKLRPEDRLADLPAAQAVLALPDEVLLALSPEYVASLPADVQSTIRTRLRHT